MHNIVLLDCGNIHNPPHIPSFLTSFLFLLSFFKSSTVMLSTLRALASSQCLTSPSTHTYGWAQHGGSMTTSVCTCKHETIVPTNKTVC